MEFGEKIFREIDFMSFFGLDFFKFFGPLCNYHYDRIFFGLAQSLIFFEYFSRSKTTSITPRPSSGTTPFNLTPLPLTPLVPQNRQPRQAVPQVSGNGAFLKYKF